MNSKLEEMKAVSKQNLQEASDTPTMVYVPDSNWQATILQLKLLTETILEVSGKADKVLTAKQMKLYLQNQQVIFDQVLERSLEIQKQTAENTTLEISKLDQAVENLSSQAGKLNEQYSSTLRELEDYKRKISLKMFRLILISQSVLIALSVALQLWLR